MCTTFFLNFKRAGCATRSFTTAVRAPLLHCPVGGLGLVTATQRLAACTAHVARAHRRSPSARARLLFAPRIVVRIGRYRGLERLLIDEALAPPGSRGIADVARLEPVPLDEVEHQAALVLQLPHRRVVVGVGANVDAHRDGEVRRAHHDAQVASRSALGHLHLQIDHRCGLAPVEAVRLVPEAVPAQRIRVHIVPQRLELDDAGRGVLGLDLLAHDVGQDGLGVLVGALVAGLVIWQRLLVGVKPKRVARRRDALAVDVSVEVPVVHHDVVPSAGEP
eukprot:scaffold18728_cov121-Isochrysis_galbana.AAC.7